MARDEAAGDMYGTVYEEITGSVVNMDEDAGRSQTRPLKAGVARTRTLTKADKYFNCTDVQRALFEAGIKLGTVYHQFVGTPVSAENVEVLEGAIEASISVQPFVRSVKVIIDRERLRVPTDQYDYLSLSGDMLTVELEVRYKDASVRVAMEYKPELQYPLMFIREVLPGK